MDWICSLLRDVCPALESPDVVVKGRLARLNACRVPVALLSAEECVVCRVPALMECSG